MLSVALSQASRARLVLTVNTLRLSGTDGAVVSVGGKLPAD